ncbi:hypothetical protein U1Q18_003207 [Sarracenia purpurea var. burkii]
MVRKPYTVTKSRESWTEPEHNKFLEALQLFDRDWKKIEAFFGSKTVIQIRSHAQKYFLKVQKSGTSEHLPPPRPKSKARILNTQIAEAKHATHGVCGSEPTRSLLLGFNRNGSSRSWFFLYSAPLRLFDAAASTIAPLLATAASAQRTTITKP